MLDEERTVNFDPAVKLLVAKNIKTLVSAGIEFSVFEPTKTGFKKSILDATQPVRIHFEITGFHHYSSQPQGPEYKVIKNAWLLTPKEKIQSKVSLYRPATKLGDPRMWFTSLSKIADAGDQIAIVILDDSAFLINLSKFDLNTDLADENNLVESFSSSKIHDVNLKPVEPKGNQVESISNPKEPAVIVKPLSLKYKQEEGGSSLKEHESNVKSALSRGNEVESLLNLYQMKRSSVADELLSRLQALAKAPFPSQRSGSTGLGYTLEKLLGISANSSKLPDYQGIEIKAGRGNLNRTTLFAQVSDWNISPCKSSGEILDLYGYQRDGHIKLYCTISALKPNSQGLSFFYDAKTDQLQELYGNDTLVAIWPGKVLRQRLLEKHTETFWVDAESIYKDGVEHFLLQSVTHTRAPVVSQLIPLIVSGAITMDHLIKRNEQTNKVTEKGPLFKIHKRDLELLFPKPIKYTLPEGSPQICTP